MKRIKSPILEAVHESAKDLHDAGLIGKTTMREFDSLCLPPVKKLSPEEIRSIRENVKFSQAAFANVLNTSVYTIRKWESGTKNPTGAALKLLNMVQDKGIEIAY